MAVDSMEIKTEERPSASEGEGLAYRMALRLGFRHRTHTARSGRPGSWPSSPCYPC